MKNSFIQVLNLVNNLDKAQLLSLNKIIVTLVKQIESQERAKKAAEFKVGDLVYFNDGNQKKCSGVVITISTTSINIITADSQKFKVHPLALQLELKKAFLNPLDIFKK
jgi:transcription antitermination factor NusG